jgi:hypothetical protein
VSRLEFMSHEPHMDNGAWECALEPVRGPTPDDADAATA